MQVAARYGAVDGAGQTMYVVAGGATNVCSAFTDIYGDGCPGTQAKFGSSGGGNYATAASPGIFGVSVDANSNLYTGDTVTNLVREVASGTQFGNVGAVQTDVVDVHFAANDSAAAGGYTLTSGASIFSLGTPSCTTNSDLTTDCLLPITVTPSRAGALHRDPAGAVAVVWNPRQLPAYRKLRSESGDAHGDHHYQLQYLLWGKHYLFHHRRRST